MKKYDVITFSNGRKYKFSAFSIIAGLAFTGLGAIGLMGGKGETFRFIDHEPVGELRDLMNEAAENHKK